MTEQCKVCKVFEHGEQQECGFCHEDYAITHMLPIHIGGRLMPDYFCRYCIIDYAKAMTREMRQGLQRCGDCGSPKTEPSQQVDYPRGACTNCEICGEVNWVYGGKVGCGNSNCKNYNMADAHRLYLEKLKQLEGTT